MGMEVWALVSNFHSGTDVDTYELLSYTSKRTYLINSLVEQTLFYGADGINVDFEQVPSKAGESYIQFIRELALKCHENNLVLSVDNYVPSEYTAHYNRKEQGLFADYVIIMGYDEHYVGSEVGSVASMEWMKQGIEDTLKVVPAEKVINGVPFYTRVWMTEGANVTSEAVDMTVANNFLAKNGLTAQWDEETNQNYAETTIGNTKYQVWMEDADSIKVRLNVMNTFGIAGVASWKLGQETPDIWDLISAYMAN
jgi:spore germination protein YaaH